MSCFHIWQIKFLQIRFHWLIIKKFSLVPINLIAYLIHCTCFKVRLILRVGLFIVLTVVYTLLVQKTHAGRSNLKHALRFELNLLVYQRTQVFCEDVFSGMVMLFANVSKDFLLLFSCIFHHFCFVRIL